MNEPIKLGSLAPASAQRDAIHVAIAPVVAVHEFNPGQRVRILDGNAYVCTDSGHGIVDPWLVDKVKPGEQFYVLLHQGTVTGMRHHWSHPAFQDQPAPNSVRSKSEQWIRDFAEESGVSYDTLMDAARDWIDGENYLCLGGLLEGKYVPGEFWKHYEEITGRKGSGSFFTCSC